METTGYFTTPTPFAQSIAHNAFEQQQIDLINQIHSHQMSINQMYYFIESQRIPFLSMAQKFHVYHFLNSLPFPTLNIWSFLLLSMCGDWIVLIFLGFICYGLYRLGQCILRAVARRLHKEDTKTFFEVTFPAHTNKSAYATEQLYTLIHTLARQHTFWGRLAHRKKIYSFEVISTKEKGIRYLFVVPSKDAETVKKSVYSYLPGVKIKETRDYLVEDNKYAPGGMSSIVELKQSDHFVLPLEMQKTLSEHDPIAYIIGIMTKLKPTELVAYQVVITPVIKALHAKEVKEMGIINKKLYNGEPLAPEVLPNIIMRVFRLIVSLPVISLLWLLTKIAFAIFFSVIKFIFGLIGIAATVYAKVPPTPEVNFPSLSAEMTNPYEKELKTVVKNKLDQSLFEVSIRALVFAKKGEDVDTRVSGFMAALGQFGSSYQSLTSSHSFFTRFKTIFNSFKNREIPSHMFTFNPILSTSELSDLYHFPYTSTTITENLVRVHSKDLPAPLSLKNVNKLDAVFGTNTYGGEEIQVGLTDDERSRHVYLIGQTGSGKSTVMYHMAKDDIQAGRGVAVIDPHGDLIEDLLATIPEERLNDFIYFNPFDLKHPMYINLIELASGLDEDEIELEKQVTVDSIISIFRRVFSDEEQSNAHRIEHILRNTTHTAFYAKDATLFTINKLLTNKKFRESVLKHVDDENLLDFWKEEFGRAGDWQVFKMVEGVTAKIETFLFSPTAKRILEKPKSTINFDEILEQEKILLCNVSEGKLGEDTSRLLGTMMVTKIQQVAFRRARKDKKDRKPFYLFIDEFQNFATSSFTKLLSGGRKFGIRVTVAQQTTAQQKDTSITNTILANTGTVICFKTASPADEDMLLPQFSPYVQKGEIMNLPRYHFYIKLGALEPEEPFSGQTLSVDIERNNELISRLIEASRKNYTVSYVKEKKTKNTTKKETKENNNNSSGEPEEN